MTALDADACERILQAALAAGDAKGVESAFVVLATLNPRRAQLLWDALDLALAVTHPESGGAAEGRTAARGDGEVEP